MAKDETEVITLEFDDGEEIECTIIGVFDYNGKDYIALDPDDESGDAYIYGYKEFDGLIQEIKEVLKKESEI